MPDIETKNCPICGEKDVPQNKGEEVTICPKCGHPFRPSD